MKNAPQNLLIKWYSQNHRHLPWRDTSNPYMIWISEIMLQQTTVKAVIPFYQRFLERFPNVHSLASASLNDVYEYWSGLGYYSRARNLHKSAQIISQNGFPKNYLDLLELPGFGPYTSRAVASFAFEENVGVLDGNVIRFLTRFYGLKIKWWQNENKKKLQNYSDQFVRKYKSSIINQAIIEIGATLCTPQSPACFLCPVKSACLSYKKSLQKNLPLKKPRKKSEIWIWKPQIIVKNNKIALIKNNYAPFLKGQFIFPGCVKTSLQLPKYYDYKHNITHHNIYVIVDRKKTSHIFLGKKIQWFSKNELKKHIPATLLQKALDSSY